MYKDYRYINARILQVGTQGAGKGQRTYDT